MRSAAWRFMRSASTPVVFSSFSSFSVLFLSFAITCALVFTSGHARAQTTTSSAPSVTGFVSQTERCEPPVGGSCNASQNADNAGENPHPNGVADSTINFEDCEANLYYQFQVGISNPSSSYSLEAWVGTEDCSQLANRQTSATSVCWPVAQFAASLVNPYPLYVRVRDIVSGAFTTTHPVTYAASGVAGSDDGVCRSQVQTGPTALVLYVFFADAEGNPYNNVQTYNLSVDMLAGDVQGNVSIGIGDTLLIVNVPPTTDPDTQGYNVYCDPPPGQETASETVSVDAATNNGQCEAVLSDGGSIDDGDTTTDGSNTGVSARDDAGGNKCGVPLNDAGVPAPGGCSTSSVLVAGGTGSDVLEEGGSVVEDEGGVAGGTMNAALQYGQPTGAKYLCGYGSASSSSIDVTGLKDGYHYNIAVACVDGNGNVGPLSNVSCAEPVPVADFWRVYTSAGGSAGGGFCSAEGAGVPSGTSGLGALTVAGAAALVRRRRRSAQARD